MPLVVKLKIRLPEMAASVITRNTRIITTGGRSTCFRARLAGATASRGTSTANSTPHTIAIAAGTAKAAASRCASRESR